MMKIAYLGPEGTFTEQAAYLITGKYWENGHAGQSGHVCPPLRQPISTIEEIFEMVESGKADFGVVPIENSIEGAVTATIDTLIFDANLFIYKQFSMPIVQNMMVYKENAGKNITKIISHPQGLAQCRKFISKNYPGVIIETASSTAEAARLVADNSFAQSEVAAAIGADISAEIYKLEIVHSGIQDNQTNTTQFVMITKTDTSEPKTGCKTSIAFSTENKPGELYKILDIFSIWDLNMTKITSRPTKNSQGEYVFFIDIEGYKNLADVKDALTMIKRKTSFYKNLGSYKVFSI